MSLGMWLVVAIEFLRLQLYLYFSAFEIKKYKLLTNLYLLQRNTTRNVLVYDVYGMTFNQKVTKSICLWRLLWKHFNFVI
jgi:hypothetical protein